MVKHAVLRKQADLAKAHQFSLFRKSIRVKGYNKAFKCHTAKTKVRYKYLFFFDVNLEDIF